MFCPQCGLESPSGLQYCRSCGANLKVIGKALTLSEAIARSDRGPLPKLKEMVKSLNVDQVTEEVSRALDRMNKEILSHSPEQPPVAHWWQRPRKTAQERRDDHISKGLVSFFSGIGLTVFLYYFTAALILKLPPDWVSKVPFEIEPLVPVLWLVGLLPMLSGAGHILAGLLIRPDSSEKFKSVNSAPKFSEVASGSDSPGKSTEQTTQHASVTERTTNLLKVQGSNVSIGGERRDDS
jgi:hypothetical protein